MSKIIWFAETIFKKTCHLDEADVVPKHEDMGRH